MNRSSNAELSIVIPVFNEEEVLAEMLRRLSLVLKKLPTSTQVIFVDDGSSDKTLEILLNAKQIHNLEIIKSFRNHGHQIAMLNGLSFSSGKYVVTLDADLQDPPELIPELYKKIRKEVNHVGRKYDVVQTCRPERGSDSLFKKYSSIVYYYLVKKISKVEITPHAADFRLMTREVVNVLTQEMNRTKVMRILIPLLGYSILEYKFERQKRYSGHSKYNFTKLLALAVDSILSTNAKPLRWISVFGLSLSIICSSMSVASLITWYLSKNIPGWTSLVFLILTLNGFILLSLGFIGEYVAKIYDLSTRVNHQVYTKIK
jgi:glycosyltransferase involved in cell wall biosynthesis